ncbi:hypothetical protein C8R47DRAFT_1207222 [Mycena vitilis]|nr:hypothetical protein C8R47DRAFT_1207222 [Mycena vitilis]
MPPSPTLSIRSSVHFSPTSLTLPENRRQLRNPSLLLPPPAESHSHRRKGSNAAADLQEDADLDSDLDSSTDPTPFRFRSNDLAMLIDPKTLEHWNIWAALTAFLTALGRPVIPGTGVGVSHRHDLEKSNKPVPAITLADPEGEKSANWDSRAAFAASLDTRRHIYGKKFPSAWGD